MTRLTLERVATDGNTTLGILFCDGVFECFALEDEGHLRNAHSETDTDGKSWWARAPLPQV